MTQTETSPQATSSKYVTPRFGPWAIGMLCVLGISIWLIYRKHQSLAGEELISTEGRFTSLLALSLWFSGVIYGLASAACWLATVVKDRYLRWLVRVIAVACLAWLSVDVQTEVKGTQWLEESLNLSGVVLLQCILFFWMKVPSWSAAGRLDQDVSRQFGIGDIVVLTTMVAIVFAMAIRYSTPIEPLRYWSVLVLAWLLQPLIAATVALGVLHRHRLAGAFLLLTAIMGAGVGAVGLAFAELQWGGLEGKFDFEAYAICYGYLIAGSSLAFLFVAIAGCLQGCIEPNLSDPARSNETDS
ncbi:MAG: hypothetical protein AB8B91_21830 [Rubripirellula sp.]